jgi:hypothetical protein
MRPHIKIALAPDPIHKNKHLVVVQLPDEERHGVLAGGLTKAEAHRLLLPLRRAFMAGMEWMREDMSSYALSIHPEVNCDIAESA